MSSRLSYSAGPVGSQSTRAHEVLALLALAPRSQSTAWTAQDLRQWVEITRHVDPEEVRDALELATRLGAGPTDVVPAATHIVLTRLAPRVRGEDALRVQRNIDSVCTHLHDHIGPAVAARLPRLLPVPGDVPRSALWAYFFGCVAVLLLVIVLTT